jgi:hypothetical protein
LQVEGGSYQLSGRHGHKNKRKRVHERPPASTVQNVQPPPQIATDEPKETFNEVDKEQSQPISHMKTISRPDPFDVALWGLIITAIIALIYYEQLRSMQDQLTVTKEQSKQEERAWLIPTYDKANLAGGQPITQVFHYTNRGKTPANNIRAQFLMVMVHDNDHPLFDYPANMVARSDVSVLFQDLQEHIGIALYVPDKYPQKAIFSGDIHDQFVNGDIIFMTYGEIRYYDIFADDQEHWVHYCTMTFTTVHNTTPPVAKYCDEYTKTDDY